MRRRGNIERQEKQGVNRGGAAVFRMKKGVKLPYHRQGYIYFLSRSYKDLPKEKQERIEWHCRMVGGHYFNALFEFVTTDAGITAICMRHFLSESTLHRIVRRYYEEFPEDL